MLDRLATWSRARVPARVARVARRAAPVALSAALFAIIGAAWPLGSSLSDASPPPPRPAALSADSKGLEGFLAMPRWGRAVHDADKARRDAEAAAAAAAAAGELNEKLARLGVIGISASAGSHAVLLTRSNGDVERLVDGDALPAPDGRVLVSVTGNSVVLENPDGGRKELLLFPRRDGTAVAEDAPADGETPP